MSMHPQATRRAELIFNLFDTNGNGVIEVDDFNLMANRVVEAAVESGEAAKAAIRVAFDRYWNTLALELDFNGDGRITAAEFSGFVLTPRLFGPTVEQFAHALAALGDPNGDGLIERPVFVALMEAIGFEYENIHALYDAFGPADGDRITVSTWVEGIKDFYAPDLVDIPGDRLVPDPVA